MHIIKGYPFLYPPHLHAIAHSLGACHHPTLSLTSSENITMKENSVVNGNNDRKNLDSYTRLVSRVLPSTDTWQFRKDSNGRNRYLAHLSLSVKKRGITDQGFSTTWQGRVKGVDTITRIPCLFFCIHELQMLHGPHSLSKITLTFPANTHIIPNLQPEENDGGASPEC
jgi:hypothetical protein